MSGNEDFSAVPAELRAIPRWVLWRWQARKDKDGGAKQVKVPQGRSGTGDALDPKNWRTFDEAVAELASASWQGKGGLGFVFANEDNLGGVDLDGCVDPSTGRIARWAQDIIDLFPMAYVERSPSGTGLHIIARGAPAALRRTQQRVEAAADDVLVADKDAFIEAYVAKRYFTVTGTKVRGDGLPDLPAAWAQLEAMMAGDESRHEREAHKKAAGEAVEPVDVEKLRSALNAFGSDDVDRNAFVAIGMALKAELGEDGREIWLDWMARSPNDDAAESEGIWLGLPDKPRSVGIGTIFHYAMAHGWKPPTSERRVKSSAAGAVLRGIIETAELWRDERGEPYATVAVETIDGISHKEHHRIDSAAFRSWLERAFWRDTDTTPKGEELKEALGLAKAKARYDGAQHRTWIRTAAHEGKLYLDLSDEAWRVVEIDGKGWRLCAEPPVRFRRTGQELPLPAPVRAWDDEGTMALFAKLVRPLHPEQLKLIVGWLTACLRPDLPIPSLILACEWGSAKTSALRAIKLHVDPRSPLSPGLPTKEDDLNVAAFNSWVLAGDNLSGISNDLADAVCRIVTGGGSIKRKLYQDEEAHALEVKRPVLMTALEMPTVRGDFVDRSIAIELARLEQAERLPERVVSEMLEKLRPDMLALLLDGASMALRNVNKVQDSLTGKLPRMADFVVWCEAAGPAYGWQSGAFLAEYDKMYAARMVDAAHDDNLLQAIYDWLASHRRDGIFEGKAGELVQELREFVDRGVMPGRRRESDAAWFPKNPRAMATQLKKHRRLLSAIGITWETRADPNSSTAGSIHQLGLRRDLVSAKPQRPRYGDEDETELSSEGA